MYAVVRTYSRQGASELFDQLEQRNEEVNDLIGGVPGFVSYTAFRSGEGGSTVTVCQDKTGTDESSRRAAEWVKEHVGATANPPVITEGSTVVHFNS
jgi:hypothetical protein